MKEVKPGDIILHYANGAIRAVSKAEEAAQEVTKPQDLKSKRWEEKGRKIEVDFYELRPEIELEIFNHKIQKLEIEKGPINSKGRVNQGYLFYFTYQGLKIIQEESPETNWPDFVNIRKGKEQKETPEQIIDKIYKYISNKGFNYPRGMIKNFYLSLKTKPFVLLAGISGTGKTKLVQLFAEYINCNSNNERFKLISVRPDWSDSSDLLGYKNLQGEFIPGPMINIIKNANKDPNNIYIICLDEMNLARVEYYFSEFLSKRETRRYEHGRIVTDKLFNEDYFENNEDNEKYGDLIIPDNLYIVGTVNMDETTHPFSKKVLDRANTIEFSEVELSQYNLNNDETTIKPVSGVKNDFLRADFLNLNDCPLENQEIVSEIISRLQKINSILKKASLHVGYRIRDEIIFYMIYNQRYSLLAEDEAFDFQLMQKILPRIQGSSGRIKEADQVSDVEFFQILQAIFDDFFKAFHRIKSSPHHRLQRTREVLPAARVKKINRQSIKWLKKNSEFYDQEMKLPVKMLNIDKKISFDTFENKFVKWIILQLIKKITIFKHRYKNLKESSNQKLNQRIIDRAEAMINDLDYLLYHTFLVT